MSENDNLMMEKLIEISEKLDQLDEKLNRMAGIGVKIREDVKINGENCKRMNDHISFIESVYSSVRSPLDYVRRFIGGDERELPEIEN